MQLAIEIEDHESWPPVFRSEAVRDRPLVLAYQRERARIDKLCQDDIFMRINPPKNKYREDYDVLVERLEDFLTPHRLVAFHCTRLTQDEIGGIKKNGLQLLTPALVKKKLDECHAAGHLSDRDHAYLTGSKSVADNVNDVHAHRTGMIWFCPNRSTLQDYSGVYRLFRSWGGEAVYCGHEDDMRIAPVLASIGTPCIVKCAIPFDRAEHYHENFSERFLAQLISDEIEYPEPAAGFDLNTKKDLEAADVLEIIEFADPRFAALTGFGGWPAHCRIIAPAE